MPKRAKGLTDVGLRAMIKRAGKGPKLIAAGGVIGLHLQVREKTCSWILRYQVGFTPEGKPRRRDRGLGGYPDVSIAEARAIAQKLRAKIREGFDPVEEHRASRAALSAVLTFDEAARRLIAAKSAEWKNSKHKEQWTSTLATYVSPELGRMPVDKIELRHVVDVLEPIWKGKTETAGRVRGRIESVLTWATVSGYRTGDNPARWRGNLDHLLPKPSKVRKVKHHTALPIDLLPDFMTALRMRDGTAARALEFAILTATRSQEVRGATWGELDLAAALWTIPGNRMKAGKEHKVPLAPRAVKLLKALPRFAGTELVFPSPTGKTLSDMALSSVTRRMKVNAVPHGFRSTFRDWAAERTQYSRDVAEMALAHTIGDKVEAAYRRGELLIKRTKMMAEWAKFIDASPITGYNVTPIRRRSG